MSDHFLDLSLLQQRFIPGQWPNLQRVVFCGNIDDPSMHPQMIDMVKHWLGINDQLHVIIFTNGSTRTARWFQELGRLSTDSGKRVTVIFAIDGLEDTNHIYRQGSDWHKLQKNWRAYIASGGWAVWQFVVFKHNEHQIDTVRALHKAEGFRELHLRYSGRSADNNEKKVTELADYETSPQVICKALVSTSVRAMPPELYINHLGDVSPCCYIDLSNIRVKDRYHKIIAALPGDAAYNLHDASMERIVSGDWFAWIHTNMQTNKECVWHCQRNLRDKWTIQ